MHTRLFVSESGDRKLFISTCIYNYIADGWICYFVLWRWPRFQIGAASRKRWLSRRENCSHAFVDTRGEQSITFQFAVMQMEQRGCWLWLPLNAPSPVTIHTSVAFIQIGGDREWVSSSHKGPNNYLAFEFHYAFVNCTLSFAFAMLLNVYMCFPIVLFLSHTIVFLNPILILKNLFILKATMNLFLLFYIIDLDINLIWICRFLNSWERVKY